MTRQQGFNLIELMIVVVIIGVLAAIVIPMFMDYRRVAQDVAAKADAGSGMSIIMATAI